MSKPALLNVAIIAANVGAAELEFAVKKVHKLDVMKKGPTDYVTEVDQRVEAMVFEKIKEYYPQIDNSLIKKIYKKSYISERHRHRYEVNFNIKEKFEKKGMIFSGSSPDNKLTEIVELKSHPWFIGVQFHPEFKSRPLYPHPLFSSFIKAAKKNK